MSARRGAALALALVLTLAASAALLAGCGGAETPEAATPPQDRPLATPRPVDPFSYETLGGGELSLATLAGRVSVIGFLVTYDDASQAQARILGELARQHTPRLNVAALALDPPANRPLVEMFAAGLGLPYPIAIADAATIAGEGPFAGLHHVPSVVILDATGREVYRRIGLTPRGVLEDVLRAVEQGGPAQPEPSAAPVK